jgi:hypothetical protein
MAICIHYGRLRIANGPLKGRHYSGGNYSFAYVDETERLAYVYRAVSPPHRRLRSRSAYFVDFVVGPMSKRTMRMVKENNMTWGGA